MPGGPENFGLTRREAGFLRCLSPPWRIQRYLDSIDYDTASACRSPRRVLRERAAQCMRRYSRPIRLERFDRLRWMSAQEDLWAIPNALARVPHRALFPASVLRALAPVDARTFAAGLVGRREAKP